MPSTEKAAALCSSASLAADPGRHEAPHRQLRVGATAPSPLDKTGRAHHDREQASNRVKGPLAPPQNPQRSATAPPNRTGVCRLATATETQLHGLGRWRRAGERPGYRSATVAAR